MINKSAIYLYNNAEQEVAQNGLVTFANYQRTGASLGFTNNGRAIRTNGEYQALVNITATPADAGIVTAQLQLNGQPITGRTASATATAGETVNLTIPVIFCHCGCCQQMSTNNIISVANTGIATAVGNIAMTVERIA